MDTPSTALKLRTRLVRQLHKRCRREFGETLAKGGTCMTIGNMRIYPRQQRSIPAKSYHWGFPTSCNAAEGIRCRFRQEIEALP